MKNLFRKFLYYKPKRNKKMIYDLTEKRPKESLVVIP